MALTLSSIETAIEDLIARLADGTEEYQYNGRRVRRSAFPQLLDSLSRLRDKLRSEESQATHQGIRLCRMRGG